MMASVWLGKKKPQMNEYLIPFIEECKQMAEQGIMIKIDRVEKVIFVKALMCISDSVARPLIRNSTQFNGLYGCGLCYHPGIRMKKGKGHARSYSIAEGEYPLRTHDRTMELASIAEQSRKAQKGIKGLSILSDIDGFDVVRSIDLDIFHAVVNVAKRFTNLWFHSSYAKEPFSVKASFHEVNSRLVSISPPDYVSRAPRSLEYRSDFRGHEWFFFVTFYSIPILKDILPSKYLNHWSKFVNGLAILMQNSVAKSEVAYASRYFREFNHEIDALYGKIHVTFSTHLLTHLERSVQDFGQPWTHSAFLFESFNGELKAAVKSSVGIQQQICKHIQLKVALKKMEQDLNYAMTDEEQSYLKSVMISQNRLVAPNHTIGEVSLLGKPKASKLPQELCSAVIRAGVTCKQNVVYPQYDRCGVNGEVYQSCSYYRTSKQDNSIVLLQSGEVFQIDSFFVISDVCLACGHYLKEKRNFKLCDRILPHIKVYEKETEGLLRFIPVLQFQSKLLSFSVKLSDGVSFRVACINVLEMEMLT
jgi:hypothetical protein